jgi:uncharacterized membrane protein YcjF (UPF0283 family)
VLLRNYTNFFNDYNIIMKKILSIWIAILLWWIGLSFWQLNTTIDDSAFNTTNTNMYTITGNDTEVAAVNISTLGTNENKNWSLIDVIKNAINWVLWMLSLIALILCLWWWFQIVTAAWDEWKQKKWMSVLKHAAIWLVVIWLSWFVVTIVFRLLRGVTW